MRVWGFRIWDPGASSDTPATKSGVFRLDKLPKLYFNDYRLRTLNPKIPLGLYTHLVLSEPMVHALMLDAFAG